MRVRLSPLVLMVAAQSAVAHVPSESVLTQLGHVLASPHHFPAGAALLVIAAILIVRAGWRRHKAS